MLVLEWKERAFIEKVNSRCFCWFPEVILVDKNGPPIWRLHTKLYKVAWNVSSNNSESVGDKDLRLGQIVYILVFYNILLSWLLPLDGFQFFFAWQWKRSIVLAVLPWILEVNASKEEKRACPFSSSTPRRKKTTKSFCKVWASKLAESDKGSRYNQEKWLKDDKASEKPIESTAKSSFTSFLTSGALFRPRSGQASDKFATGPAPYKNRTKDFFESLL